MSNVGMFSGMFKLLSLNIPPSEFCSLRNCARWYWFFVGNFNQRGFHKRIVPFLDSWSLGLPKKGIHAYQEGRLLFFLLFLETFLGIRVKGFFLILLSFCKLISVKICTLFGIIKNKFWFK